MTLHDNAGAETGKAAKNGAGERAGEGAEILCVVDLGTQSRKRIKKLKEGRGKLVGKIENIVDDLSQEGVVPADAAVVVVLVKQEHSLSDVFDDDDD